jgi:methylphosphotriester-DNA--protein-cysteine methyltransferase
MRKVVSLVILGLFCFNIAFADQPCNYIGNKKSKKYHLNTCRMVGRMEDKNKICLTSPTEAKILGYDPCKICKPNKQIYNNKQDNPLPKEKIFLAQGE